MKSDEQTKVRYSNIELLRILAMFMIVVYHIVYHCVRIQLVAPASLGRGTLDSFNHPLFYKRLLILNTIMSFGIIGNAIFILISGFFMANRKPENIKLGAISKKLLLQLGFAAVLLVCGSPILHYIKPDIYIDMPNITIFNDMSWFVGYYYIVVLCGALFLNDFLAKLSFERYAAFLLTLFAFTQFTYSGGFAEAVAGGARTILTGVFLYSLGGFIQKFNPFKKIRVWFLIFVTIGVYFLIWVSGYNVTETKIETYIRNGTTDPFIQSVPDFTNFSIVIIILSVCLFEMFRRIRLPESKIISFVGKSTFMVYLIHDNTLFYEIWNLKDWITVLKENTLLFMLNILKWAACTFLIGVVAYVLFVILIEVLKRSKKIIMKNNV